MLPPWKQKNPKPKGKREKLSAGYIKKAKARAKAAGRPYPNLVDNMAVSKMRKAAIEKRSK